jgi:peroxiredoxin
VAKVGEKVEPFRVVRGVGDVVTSDELLAEGPLVIHFFPFAFTGSVAAGSGCEAQVCGFGARLDEFEALGVRVIAVSRDSPQALAVWREQLGQRYEFLSDWEWQAATALGVLLEEGLETFRPLNTRGAFLLDGAGVLRYAFVADVISQLPPVGAVLEAAQELADGQ